jgi:hypothetical protein
MNLSEVYLSLLQEKHDMNITQIIKDLTNEYIRDKDGVVLHNGNRLACASAYDIDNGLCVEFSEDLMERLGGENGNQFILSTDMFCNYDALQIWEPKDVIETFNGSGWSKRMLKMYGEPKIDYDLRQIDDLPHHQWSCINHKHYDAENPEGTNSPWELLFFKKFFINFKEEFL